MNNLKFFVYQVLLSFLGIAVDILFREFIYESSFFNNRYIPAIIKTSINGVLLYFMFKLFSSLNTTKLRYKILIHIAAFILGAILVGLTGSFLGM
ncbi:hypothetical protein [Paenibacillus sp. LHD-38]|uniref:hypothetical protein n=1 Tax=Paenibacillus sp. LHD-38 TaxID=3072143 RepID=UPI00280DEDBC|nr:hypothetical protein [Paenibacillus sp. LHD-38]MDQ8739386.1 hypothetical protein [Paenibacillus sp. LHD-38]